MRSPLLALILVVTPCASQAIDIGAQLAGWRYGTQLLDAYPIRTHSLPIANFESKLDEINREINAIPYVSDAATYREASFWQTPIQFAQSGGECRDYVVAKYSALYALGVADSDMLFTAVRIKSGHYKGQLHAVLIVHHAGRTFILDNLHPNVRPASAMADYEPIYFINRISWKVAP